MHQAIKYGMLSLAKYLIDIPEIDIKKLDGQKKSPAFYAIEANNNYLLSLLTNKDPKVIKD